MIRALALLCLAGSLAAFAQAPSGRKAPKAAPAPAAAAKPAPAPAPAATAFVGNKESKTFHRADCSYAGKMKASNRVGFASAAEAAKAGYKPCKVCKPQ